MIGLPAASQRLVQIHRCNQPIQPHLAQLLASIKHGPLAFQQGEQVICPFPVTHLGQPQGLFRLSQNTL
tara:strand:- start:1 stop:207 length:207 start_codon:yes stop_codon:yes gene_type:complete